jgi:hypothetical protein
LAFDLHLFGYPKGKSMSKQHLSILIGACLAIPSFAQQQLNLPAGTWVSVRLDQVLSSDRNQAGDSFTATLSQPLIANGIVVARRGQTVAGRVAEANKGGRVKGTSRLGIEIIELSLVDGSQMPVRTQLMSSTAGTSRGRDAAAVATTTGVGAAIGAAAAGGSGAGLGAVAGLGAAAIGVLASRGRATELYPEDLVTFRTLSAITISTQQAEHAFQPIRQEDYPADQLQNRNRTQTVQIAPLRNFYDPFWGPTFGYGWGPGWSYFGGPRGFVGGGRGFRRFR